MSNHDDYLFCYSRRLFRFLTDRGVRYLCKGINENTGGWFWLFVKTPETRRLLDGYKRAKTNEPAVRSVRTAGLDTLDIALDIACL